MVKRMSTPDIYVAYYAFTWRVYGFLAGCKGMRRKNAGANDSWVDRRCVRRHKFDTCHPHFPFFRPLPHRTRIQKDIWTARREGVRVWTKRRIHVGNFSYCSVSRIFDRLSSSKTVISSYVDEIRNEENCRRSSNDIWSRIWWGIYFSHGENLRTPPHLDNLNFQYLHYGMEDGMEDMAILILNLILNLLLLLIENLNYNNKFIDTKTLMKLFILDLLINDLFYCYLMIKLILLFFSGVQVKSWFNNYDLDLFFFKLS